MSYTIYDRYKDRGIDIVQTEACYFGPMDEYYLRPAKHYAYDIINSIRVGCTGFIDWNMLHTVEGTPAHRQGPSHSPIMVDEKTREYVVHPSYYVIKHLGKYIKEGNRNLDIKTNIPINKVADLTVCSVLNPDTDEVTVLVSNRSDVMKTMNINDESGNRNVKVRIKANSVNSYTWSNRR
ncbi:MAG: hypothetical protein MI739_11240, partial [Bacteroidales bacterium]|nr:hypothetical protein [Bacteroidales bacterium]